MQKIIWSMEKLEYVGPYMYYMSQAKGLSSSAICAYAGITYMELNSLFTGRFEAHPNTLKRICDYMGIDFIALFKKQDKYRGMLDEAFHALTYDILDEQKELMQKINKIDYEKSILFPEFLLLKIIDYGMNDQQNPEYEELLEKISIFTNMMCDDHKGLYYIYKGIFYRSRLIYDKCEHFFQLAEKIPSFSYCELLYQHYGVLSYLCNRYVESLNYYSKAYELYEKKWNINRLLYTTCSIGYCYIGMRCYELAEHQLLKTLQLAKQYKNDFVIINSYEDLCYNHFLTRNYKECIQYGLKAIQAGSKEKYVYLFISYSYAKVEDFGEADLWAGKRNQMDVDCFVYKGLVYVKRLIDRQEQDIAYLQMLYQELPEDLKEMRILLLEDLSRSYHDEGRLKEENEIMYEIIRVLK